MTVKTTYTQETIGLMNLFEEVTHAKLKDCFLMRDKLVFLIQDGEMGRALGKNKVNLLKLDRLLNRRFKIVEFIDDPLRFVVNLMAPLRVKDIKEADGIVTINGPDEKTRGLMIGAKAQNLRAYEEVVQKYFPEVKEIKVV